jgi:hypothetical protein
MFPSHYLRTIRLYTIPFSGPVSSIWVINDGPGAVFVALNKSAFGDAPMAVNEALLFQADDRKIRSVRFVGRTGTTATVRVFVVR